MAVMIHREILYRLSKLVPILCIKHRYRPVVGIFGALMAHITEIWIFAFGYYCLLHFPVAGSLTAFDSGKSIQNLVYCVYYSFITYTTPGFGDMIPTGTLRFLTGPESLTGLILIAWTASFIYIEIQKYRNE